MKDQVSILMIRKHGINGILIAIGPEVIHGKSVVVETVRILTFLSIMMNITWGICFVPGRFLRKNTTGERLTPGIILSYGGTHGPVRLKR